MQRYANRGRPLEELILWVCAWYKRNKIAMIDKVATPIRPVNVVGGIIRLAYFEKKSTVDFVGSMCNGKIVAFDCKETKGSTLPMARLEQHQYDYLKWVDWAGGLAFLIVEYTEHKLIVRIPFCEIDRYWQEKQVRGRGAIKYDDVLKYKIMGQKGIGLDFLASLY